MTNSELFSTIRVPQELRRKLKRLAAADDRPMYKVLEEWLDAQILRRVPRDIPEEERAHAK